MKYSAGLDGLRAVAAIMVVFFHARVPGFGGGFIGVDVFFVLSGYLITRLLRDEYESSGSVDYKRFFTRRLRRLYPALILLLAIYFASCRWTFPHYSLSKHLQDVVLAGLYLSDYARTWGIPQSVLNHTWSLSVEEKFYVLWPLAFLMLARRFPGNVVRILVGGYVFITVWRYANIQLLDNPWTVYDRFDTHCTGLLLGCAMGYNRIQLHKSCGMLGAMGLIYCVVIFEYGSPMTATWGFTVAELASALLVGAQPFWLGGTILPWIGRLSYGLYLWHYPLVRFGRDQFWDWPELLMLGLIGGTICAAISYYCVEKRFHSSLAYGNHRVGESIHLASCTTRTRQPNT